VLDDDSATFATGFESGVAQRSKLPEAVAALGVSAYEVKRLLHRER
jgi:hypothetical protein